VGVPFPRVCCWSLTDWSGTLVESDIATSSAIGSSSASGGSVSMSSRGAAEAELGGSLKEDKDDDEELEEL